MVKNIIKKLKAKMLPDGGVKPVISSQGKRNTRNAAYNTSEFLVNLITLLIATPIFLKYLGIELFGVWIIINTILGFSEVLTFGMGKATVKFVSKYRAMGEESSIARIIQGTWALYMAFGFVGAITVFAAAPWLVDTVFKVAPDLRDVATIAMRWASLGIIMRFSNGVFNSALEGFERFDYTAKTNVVFNTAVQVGRVTIVLLGFSIDAMTVLTVAGLMCSAIAKFSLLRFRLVNTLRPFPLLTLDVFKEIFSFSFYTWLSSMADVIRGSIDVLIIGMLLGADAVAWYSVPVRAMKVVHLLLIRVFAFLFPLVSKLYEMGNIEAMRSYFDRINVIVGIAASMMVLPLCGLAWPILSMWVGNDAAIQSVAVMQVLGLRFVVGPLNVSNTNFLLATGHVKVLMVVRLVSAVVLAFATVILIDRIGLVGAALAQGTIFIDIVAYRFFIERVILKRVRVMSPVLPLAAVTIPFFLVCIFSSHFYLASDQYMMVIGAGIFLSGFAFVLTGGIFFVYHWLEKRVSPFVVSYLKVI